VTKLEIATQVIWWLAFFLMWTGIGVQAISHRRRMKLPIRERIRREVSHLITETDAGVIVVHFRICEDGMLEIGGEGPTASVIPAVNPQATGEILQHVVDGLPKLN